MNGPGSPSADGCGRVILYASPQGEIIGLAGQVVRHRRKPEWKPELTAFSPDEMKLETVAPSHDNAVKVALLPRRMPDTQD